MLRPRTSRRLLILILLGGVVAAGVVARHASRSHRLESLLADARHLGLIAHMQKRHGDAVAKLGYYLSHVDDDVDVILAYADATVARPSAGPADRVEAARWLENALVADPGNVAALEQLLALHRGDNRPALCEDVADRLLAVEPDHPDALASKACVAMADGRTDIAVECVRHLTRIEPDQMRWRCALVEIRSRSATPVEQIVRECGMNAYVAWVEQLLNQGRHVEALDAVIALHRTGTEWPPKLHAVLARAWLADGNVHRSIGLTHAASGQAMSVADFLTIMCREYPGHPALTALLIDALVTLHEQTQANAVIERVLAEGSAELALLQALVDVSRRRQLGWEERLTHHAHRRFGPELLEESGWTGKGIR